MEQSLNVHWKTCLLCKKLKPLDNFCFKDKKNNKRQAQCRECTRMAIRTHYYNNTEYYHTKAKKRRTELRIRAQKFILEYLRLHPCVDCNEKDIVVLEFDHMRDKKDEIGNLLKNSNSLKMIQLEIEKCVVRCANCHRRKTAKEAGNWFRSI